MIDRDYKPGMLWTRVGIDNGRNAQRKLDAQRGDLGTAEVQYLLKVIADDEKARRRLAEVYGEEYAQRWIANLWNPQCDVDR